MDDGSIGGATQSFHAEKALSWVNLLVPGHFDEAAKMISPDCRYDYQGEILMGPAVIRAFIESHERASRELDSIEYLPAKALEAGPGGVLVAVADKISLNGRNHTYNDRLRVKMEKLGNGWMVTELQHLPIAEERARLKEFLQAVGPKLG